MKILKKILEAGGEQAGKMELIKTSIDDAYNYAKKLFAQKGEDIDKELPKFKENYKQTRIDASKGKTIRKDMPVIATSDMKEFQRRLEQGSIDINLKHKAPDTNPKNPFPQGLTGEQAKKWLADGLKINDGDENDDKVKVKMVKIEADKLKPIQKQIYFDKAMNAIVKNGVKNTISFLENKSILVISSDNYIIDGHHRFLSAMLIDPKMKVQALQIDLPIKTLLPMSLAYGDAIGNKRNEDMKERIERVNATTLLKEALIKSESAVKYQDFVKQMIKKKGYKSFDDIPKDKLGDFWKMVDKEWNSSSEPGPDGHIKKEATESVEVKKGLFHKWAISKGFIKSMDDKIPCKAICAGLKDSDPHVVKMANFARNFSKEDCNCPKKESLIKEALNLVANEVKLPTVSIIKKKIKSLPLQGIHPEFFDVEKKNTNAGLGGYDYIQITWDKKMSESPKRAKDVKLVIQSMKDTFNADTSNIKKGYIIIKV